MRPMPIQPIFFFSGITTLLAYALELDDFSSNHHPALTFCLSMIFFRRSPHPLSLPRKRGRDKGWGFRDHALRRRPVHPLRHRLEQNERGAAPDQHNDDARELK